MSNEGATPKGRHFYRFYPEDLRDARPKIGRFLKEEAKGVAASKWNIASMLGLASIPIGRISYWPNGSRTKLEPNDKEVRHYADALAIECRSSEHDFLQEEVADFKHHGTSYRIIRHKDMDYLQSWVKRVLATEAPPPRVGGAPQPAPLGAC